MTPNLSRTLLRIWPVLFLVTACRDAQPVAYRVAKEKDPAPQSPAPASESPHGAGGVPMVPPTPAPAAGAAMANTPVATAAGAGLAWIAPSHWQAKAASSMRKGTYIVNGSGGQTAELAITAFPGDVGGEVANVNRWRGQLQLAPLDPAQASASITRLEANGLKIGLVDLLGTAGGGGAGQIRMTGAMVPFADSTWFFKLTGPDALVAQEKAAFTAFLQTLKPATP